MDDLDFRLQFDLRYESDYRFAHFLVTMNINRGFLLSSSIRLIYSPFDIGISDHLTFRLLVVFDLYINMMINFALLVSLTT